MSRYASLSETKTYLNVTTISTDDLINSLILSASSMIDDYVGYTFEVEYGSDESLQNVSDLDMIILRKFPVVGISSIESGVSYQVVNDTGIIILDELFTGDLSLSVSFGQNPPETVKIACMELVNIHWMRRTTSGLKSMQMGDFSYTTQDASTSTVSRQGATQNVLDTLVNYKDMYSSRTYPTYNKMR